MNQLDLGRREFVRGAAGLIAAPALIAATRGAMADPAIVETASGKVRGMAGSGVTVFKGLAYASDTGGTNRFMAPRPVKAWAGVRDAFTFGDRCVQAVQPINTGSPRPAEPQAHYSENCCVLNIYTPATGLAAKRAVIVYIHGGGYQNGSGDGAAIEGSRLALAGDIVVVTLNHRLNVFGYGNLAYLHPDFADSGNTGQLDLIAALRWIKQNIAAFGGDPSRVTIMGESGGGAKIVALSVMHDADGLYRNTINMSGSGAFFLRGADESHRTIDEMLRILGIDGRDPRQLQSMPAQQLFAAHERAIANLKADQARPVVDGRNIRCAPQSPEGIALQAATPGILSCVASEASLWLLQDRRNLHINEAQLRAKVAAQFGLDDTRVSAVLDAYRIENPQQSVWQTLVDIASDALMRTPMRLAAEQRSRAGKAPVYLCDFTWTSPVDDGIWGGPHAIDVPFAFGNIDKSRLSATGGGSAAAATKNLMAAYSAFARNGTPDNPNMPAWRPYGSAARESMVINDTCHLASDVHPARRLIDQTLKAQTTFDVTDGPMVHFVS